MTQPTLAIIQFPGSNCEYETLTACRFYGINAQIIRWNEESDIIKQFSGFILPGGFSYQDRVRSGAIASKLPIIRQLTQAADEGKPILGICNGCQILAEAGLFPDTQENKTVQVALTHNDHVSKSGKRQKMGFICDWVYIKIQSANNSVFTRYFNSDTAIPIPTNHGEGQFQLSENLDITSLTQLIYCNADGSITPYYPTNPNGSAHNIAGLSNPKGNVLGLMPHPERAAFLHQIPTWIASDWGVKKRENSTEKNGPWEPLFIGLRDALEGR